MNVYADIVIAKDTSVNNIWTIPATTILRFETGGHISGNGGISGGVIQANPYQFIFDTTISVNPAGLYNSQFSVRWYGANPVNSDNYNQFQKAINTCVNAWPLFIPKGTYDITKPLLIQSIYLGEFVGCQIHIFGESSFWNVNSAGSVLNFKIAARTGVAVGINLGKGAELDHFVIQGEFVSPSGTDTVYFNTSYNNYTDQSNKHDAAYRGLGIDVSPNPSGSGSTGVYVHDMIIKNFYTLIAVSRNGTTLNGDILIFERIQFGDGRLGFMSCQGQEKGNEIKGLYSWGSLHTLFSSGNELNGQGGNYNISDLNIAGRCIRPFWCNQNGWGQISISRGFFEGVGTIGILNTGTTLSISECTFDFAYPTSIGYQTLLTSLGTGTRFTSCNFRYFGVDNLAQNFVGIASFDNCYLNGMYTNSNPAGKVSINTSSLPPPSIKVFKAP